MCLIYEQPYFWREYEGAPSSTDDDEMKKEHGILICLQLLYYILNGSSRLGCFSIEEGGGCLAARIKQKANIWSCYRTLLAPSLNLILSAS